MKIPLDRRAGEQRGDALGALEGVVEGENKVRHKAKIELAGEPGLEERRAALQP